MVLLQVLIFMGWSDYCPYYFLTASSRACNFFRTYASLFSVDSVIIFMTPITSSFYKEFLLK